MRSKNYIFSYVFKLRSKCEGRAQCIGNSKSDETKLEVKTKAMAPRNLALVERYPSRIKITWSYDGVGTPNEAAGIWILNIGNQTRPLITDALLDP